MKPLVPLVPLAIVLALSAAACSGSSSSTTTTTPTTTQTTETFSGTVPVQGSAAHNFSVSAAGTVTVTLTAASPPDGVVMGLGIGTPNGSSCALLNGASANISAGGAPVSGIVSAGALCARVSALPSQTAAVNYTLSVVHP